MPVITIPSCVEENLGALAALFGCTIDELFKPDGKEAG